MGILALRISARSELLSFFDEGDEPPTAAARPRRTMSTPVAGGPADRQTMMVRRAVAGGIGLLLLILVIVGIKGCLDSRKRSALKSYNRDVSTLVTEADSQISKPFLSLLQRAKGKSPQDLETQINDYRISAQEETKRAQGLDVPGEMSAAQRDLVLALNLRSEALGKIAAQVRSALAVGGDQTAIQDAYSRIAGEMQEFLASDVIYAQRVKPLIQQALNDDGIHGETTASSSFLPDLSWLDPGTVQSRLGGGGAARRGAAVAPGTHGHALLGVSVGGKSLDPAPAVNRVSGAANPTFTIKLSNSGTNDETAVKVDVTVKGRGKTVSVSKTIDKTKTGTEASVDIPLGTSPRTGAPLRIEVNIEGVPGEKNLANNKGSFTVIFSR
jgi:hypothetical protein